MDQASSDLGATVVISHRVRSDKHAEYEAWVEEISPLSRSAPGHLDWNLVRPIPGATETYTVIIRFQTTEHVKNWMNSSERKRLIEKVQPLLVSEDDFYISSGLDFWFTPAGAKAKVPVRWKQYLLTWSAIYPLVLGVPRLVSPALRRHRLPAQCAPQHARRDRSDRVLDGLCGHAALHAPVAALAIRIKPRRQSDLPPRGLHDPGHLQSRHTVPGDGR